MATEEKRVRSRSRESSTGGRSRSRSHSRDDHRRRAKRRHHRPRDHRSSHRSRSHHHSHSRSRGKEVSSSRRSRSHSRSRSRSRSSESRGVNSRRSPHRRGPSSSEERRERTKGREEDEVRSRDREEHQRRRERELSVTPEEERENPLPVEEKREEKSESESSFPEAKESEGASSEIALTEVDETQDEPEVEDKGEEKVEKVEKNTKEKDPSFRFEHLEAIRNVQLITRNEYPLDHLQRDKLVNRDYDDFDDEDGDGICYCSYPDDLDKDKRRCDDVSCLNFATYVECNAHCPAREYCSNQRLQHPHLFPKLEAFKTEHKGFGVRTTEDIAQSQIIGEYVGEIIDQKELTYRLKSAPRNELNFYYLLLEPGIYIDARNKGSFTRFVNHSCEPNCKTEKWTVKGETRIAVIALRDINDGEELTFDYQWKALGSRQIKCFCESANCKGIIGTEGDTVKDNTPRGVFREPKVNEIGAAIVNRRIRIFKSPDDHSQYYIATIKSFDKSDGVYEVDYQDTTDEIADEDEDVFDSPGEKTGERYIRLSELDWHIFVEFDGLSEDQMQKEFFSIPKRRVTDQQTESREPSPKKDESRSQGPPPVRSSREASPSSAMSTGRTISNAPVSVARKNIDEESVDADGNVVTNKILVKGIPIKCNATILRSLFVVDDRRSKLAGASDPSARPASQDIVKDLDFFFFNDDSGWALVELSTLEYASMFQRKLNNRPLFKKELRAYFAGRKEVENFQRAKRNFALRRRQDSAANPSASSGGRDAEQQQDGEPRRAVAADVPKATGPYCFGRKLNWQVNVEEMEDSPTRRLGISPSLEQTLRAKCVVMIFRLVKRLHLDREDATSAIIALNRYFTFHAMSVRNVEYMAASVLHLFLKAHSRKFSWEAFVSEVYATKNSIKSSNGQTRQLHAKSDEFLATQRPLFEVEKELLEGLRYDLSSEDPYALLDSLTSGNKGRKKHYQHGDDKNPSDSQIFPSDVHKEAKHLVADALRLPIWVQIPVECIVLSIVYVSAAVTQALKENVSGSSENPAGTEPASTSRPDFLPVLDGRRNELESLMLLECSLSICDNLKERWNRLEKIANPSLKASQSDDYFDTEQFAVAREKPVEISQRISLLLKSWINVPSSSIGGASVSPDRDSRRNDKTEFITLSMIGKSSASASISGDSASKSPFETRRGPSSRYGEQHASEVVSAATVVPTHVAKGPRGGSLSILSSSDRLHTTEIVNVEMIRKRNYLGTISEGAPFDLAGKKVYLQPWSYRDAKAPFSKEGDISKSCVRELSAAIILHSRSPSNFVKLYGIVFPEEKKSTAKHSTSESASESESKPSALLTTEDLDAEMMREYSDVNGLLSSPGRLDSTKHYLAYEQPLHMYSGIVEAKVPIPMQSKKKAIFDMLQGLAVCHELNYVHRFIAPQHLYIFENGAKLGGYHATRKTVLVNKTKETGATSSNVFEMSENERKELCTGAWVSVTAPEILLGDRNFSWRCDVWSAGALALAILLDSTVFLQGMDTRTQLDLIFRLCGTPHVVWEGATKLPLFGRYKPKDEYKMRLRKSLTEYQQKQKRDALPDEAFALLESMLQVDPSKRLSAKKLLELGFFADVRSAAAGDDGAAVDFSGLEETYSTQKKKLLAHLKTSKPKRRRPSGSGEFSSSSSHRPSSHSQNRKASEGDLSKRESSSRASAVNFGSQEAETLEDVPLPSFINASSKSPVKSKSSLQPARPEKRAKLGWGMGLHSEKASE